MAASHPRALAALGALAFLSGCGPDAGVNPTGPGPGIEAHRSSNRWSAWAEPVNLGAPVNTSGTDFNPTLSPDERSLYFASDRPGGSGGIDIWVSQRDCADCPWQAAVNLGPTINTSANDNGPNVSVDGRMLFFFSNRPGGQGGNDIYLSRRDDRHNDLGWAAPVNLGPHVNTAGNEAGAEHLRRGRRSYLYFNRAVVGGTPDIHVAMLSRDEEPLADAVLVAELSDPTASDQAVTVRNNGKELLFNSDRLGTLGLNDLWVSVRRSVREPWSAPANLGVPLNTALNDQQASLSSDARTLVFVSNRPGGQGGFDIWVTTRTRGHHADEDDDGDDGVDGERRGNRRP